MQVIGFNFSKIAASRNAIFKHEGINTNIEFTGIDKEEIEIIKEPAIKVGFKFTINYEVGKEKKKETTGEVLFEGYIILTLTEQEQKDVLKFWKKKELPSGFRVPLFNLILQKCSVTALNLEDDIGLPHHIPMPRLAPQQKQEGQ